MECIRIISTSTVQPATSNGLIQRMDLTPWDLPLLSVDCPQRGFLFLKPTALQETELKGNLVRHLQTSLTRALDIFPPFAGRLVPIENDDKTTSFFLACNGAGAQFIHAVAEGVTVADILEPLHVPAVVQAFFPMNGLRNVEGISKPLLVVQMTELVDGIFMGFTYNHGIADGTSFWHFLSTWSGIARNSDHPLPPPIMGHWFLDGVDPPIPFPFSYREPLPDKPVQVPFLEERVFHLTKGKISMLKARANDEIGTNTISSLQAVLGQLWRSIIRNRHLPADREIHCRCLLNMRPRLQPPLPEKYFGNAVQFGTATTTAGELVEHGPGWAAWQIKKMVSLQTDAEARKYCQSWIKRPNMSTFKTNNSLVVAGSPWFNAYGNDFGWGKPIAVRGGGGNNFDGKVTVFPGAEEGSMDLQVCLSPKTLQAVGNDADFMEFVAST